MTSRPKQENSLLATPVYYYVCKLTLDLLQIMDGEDLEMLWESPSVSTVSPADPTLDGITSQGPSSIDLDEQLQDIVAKMTDDVCNVSADDRPSCESMTCGDDADAESDLGAPFNFSDSDNEVRIGMSQTPLHNVCTVILYMHSFIIVFVGA